MAEQEKEETTIDPPGEETVEVEIPERKTTMQVLKEWPLPRKVALGAALVISISLFVAIMLGTRTADQQLLYANLSATDAAAVTEWLKGQKVPYSLKDSGKSIWIPTDKIYQARLDLASNGLPNGGDVGFEVFDKQSFALTDYVQKVNYTRALQGELARTISSLAPVATTRVHLAIPEKRLFKNQQKAATASIIIDLIPGKKLSNEQVDGIIHLVSGSVSGLDPENVKVINSNGVVLGETQKSDSDRLLSTDMLAFQREIETQMEMRAQDLLDRTMGKEHALVRVTATVDFAKVEKTEELYDSDDPVIRSEQINNENNQIIKDGGVPGVESNLQGNQPSTKDNGTKSSKNARTTNYEISKTVSHIVNPVGTVTKLSVSVLVADRLEQDEQTNKIKTIPLEKKELNSIKDMISSAIGLVPDRGDVINVTSMPFIATDESNLREEDTVFHYVQASLPFAKYILLLFAILAIYLIFIRPIMKTVKGEVKGHNKTVDAMEKEQEEARLKELQEDEEEPLPEIPEVEIALANIRREVMHEYAPTAFIIKSWLQEE
ncbi:MAG: flagellar basal-body MS-ring/collar protein FliF [Desulfotalea sp.]